MGRLYQSAGNTRGLNKLSALLASCNTTDFEAQNNLAATSLLLKVDVPRANELARVGLAKFIEPVVVGAS